VINDRAANQMDRERAFISWLNILGKQRYQIEYAKEFGFLSISFLEIKKKMTIA
jgi:hypothetical protein